jgi:hypothetical protein
VNKIQIETNDVNLLCIFTCQYFDIAGVMEGYSSPLKDGKSYPAVGRGWEMNTGMFAIKRSAAPLMQRWIDEFVKNADVFVEAESGEQQCE